ncbi:uncharacterized protein [Argopecten irradians]|uniref:uncharacterized protein n=1 Tax=Argopecten irradians TaxID=31199 RepID=UPI003713CBAF
MYSSIAASTSWTKNTTDLYSSTAASTFWTQNTTDLYPSTAASTSWTKNTTDLYSSTAASTYWTQNTTDLYSSTAESTSWTKNTTDLYSSTAESTSWTQNTTDLYSSTAASTYWTQNTTDLYSSTAASTSWTKNTTDLYLSTAASTSWTQNTTDLYSSIAPSTSWTQNTTDLYSSIAALTSWTQNTTDLYPSTAASTSWTQNTTDLYSSLAASTSWTQNTTDLYSSLAASTYWTQNTTDLYSSTAASTSWTQNTTDLYSSEAASTSWTQNTTDLYPSKAASTYWTQNTTDLYSSTAAFSWSQEASYTTITGSFETQTAYSSTLLPSKTIPLTMTSLHNLKSTTSLRHTTDYFATVPLNDTHITTTTLTFTSYSKNFTYSSMNPSSEIHSTPMTKQYTTEYSSTVIYDDTSPFTPPVSSTEQTSSFTTAQKTGIASTAAPLETTTQGCLTFSHNNGKSYKKEEESNLTLICEFNTSGNCDTIRWKIRSYESDKNTTKITITHNVTRDRSKSKLVIRQLSLNDKGNISCHLGNGNITFDISVQPLPRLDIFPPSSVVENGNRVDLVCNISNADKINITGWKFSWQRNGSNVTTGISRNTSASSLHFTSSSNGIYQCKLCQKRSPEQCQISRNSSVQVYKTAAAKCGAGTDSGIHWEDTPAGFQLEKKCPESNSGTATRKCDTNGKWENTNMIYCVSKEIEEATKTIKDLEGLPDEEKKEEIGGVLDSIKNVTSESNRPKEKAISSGNLRATNEALTSMVNIINNSSIEMDNTTQKNFVGIIDDMLSVENKNSWTEVDDQSDITSNSVPAAGTLLTTVETFGVSVAKSLLPGESVDLVNTNLVIKIKNTNGSVIDFKPTDSAKGTSIDFNLDSNKIQNGNVTFTAALYKTMGTLLQNSNSTDVTSEVLALSVPGHNTSYLPSGVILTFDLNNLTNENNFTEGNNKRCVFWNNTQGWDSGGCRWKNGSCNCTHLTNFAVIMSPVKASDAYVLRIISFVGCILSVISTVTTVVVYLKLWRYLKSDGSRLLLNLCTALTFAYVLFLAGIDQTQDSVMCTTMAALLHYFFLSTFCLMLAEGIQLLISVTFVFHATSKLKWLLLVGWGLPLVIVGITIGVTYDNEYKAEDYCWLTLSNGVIYSFVGPAVCIIMINVIVIFHVMKAMFSSKLIATKTEKQKIFAGVRSVMVLLPILGITWLFGIISINNDLLAFQYLFAVTNSLQGFFIFLFYCIFNQPVRKALEKKIKRFESRTQSSRTGSKLQMLKTNSSDSITDDEIRLDDFHIPRLRLPPPSMDQRGEDGQQILPSRQYSSSSSWYDNDQYGSRLLKSNPDGKQF